MAFLLLPLTAVVAACGSSPAPRAATATRRPGSAVTSAITWSACGKFQCGSLAVPLDAAQPNGQAIRLALIRAPATDRNRRIGSLLINPGGPGGSTIQEFSYLYGLLGLGLRERFDVVGFDPRGVGASNPLHCLTTSDVSTFLGLDLSSPTRQALDAAVADSRHFATACKNGGAALLPHIGTRDVARDMDRIRAAVGDAKLTYFGFSYGSYLGSVYAELFPGRVRALALDGAVDPSLAPLAAAQSQAAGFQHELDAFLRDCGRRTDCVWKPGGDPTAAFRTMIGRLRTHPLPATGSRTLGPGEAFYAVAEALYSRDEGWPLLARGLAEAQRGRGRILLALADAYAERTADGHYSNLLDANAAVTCADHPWPRDPAAYETAAAAAARVAPDFGRPTVLSNLPCAFWPAPATAAVGPIRAPGTPPVLIVGSTGDPATPYSEAVSLARQFPHGVLVTRVGDGHTGYDESPCVASAVDAYLLTLHVPTGAAVHCAS